MDSFEQFARSGLDLAGLEADDVDIAVMRAVDAAYGPAVRSLDALDMSGLPVEPDLDPGRPPSGR